VKFYLFPSVISTINVEQTKLEKVAMIVGLHKMNMNSLTLLISACTCRPTNTA